MVIHSMISSSLLVLFLKDRLCALLVYKEMSRLWCMYSHESLSKLFQTSFPELIITEHVATVMKREVRQIFRNSFPRETQLSPLIEHIVFIKEGIKSMYYMFMKGKTEKH